MDRSEKSLQAVWDAHHRTGKKNCDGQEEKCTMANVQLPVT